jgi:hypothetical protein
MVLFLNASLEATSRLRLSGEGVYTHAQGSFDPFQLPSVSWENETAPRNWDGDFSRIATYSELHYIQLEGTIGANFVLSPRARVYGAIAMQDLQDERPYVYGDLRGQLMSYSAGLSMDF